MVRAVGSSVQEGSRLDITPWPERYEAHSMRMCAYHRRTIAFSAACDLCSYQPMWFKRSGRQHHLMRSVCPEINRQEQGRSPRAGMLIDPKDRADDEFVSHL